MDIQPFKNRKIDHTKKVDVYRCLNRTGHVFSIKQNGLVVAHTTDIQLIDVDLIVNKSGKKRALETKIRNVHAFLRGYIDNTQSMNEDVYELRYYPFDNDGFYVIKDCEKLFVKRLSSVKIDDTGVYAN